MDKIDRSLQKLSGKEKERVKKVLKQLEIKNLEGLQIKKLKGYNDIFRVRKGNMRIIYRLSEENQIFVLAIERRSEKTYRDI